MLSEIGLVREECLEALNNLDRWASPEYVKTSLMFKINKCHIKKDPVGTRIIFTNGIT